MPEGFMGGFAQGMSPMMQSLMYAQALRNSGMTNPATGAPYSADQGGSMLGDAARWVGRQFGLAGRPQATAANPYVPSVANGGIAPATPGAGPVGAIGGNFSMGAPPQYRPPVPPPAPVQAQRPLPIPPTPFPQSPIAQQGPPQPLPRPAPWPASPIPLNAGDVGSGTLVGAPLTGGYGAFGNITAAPSAAQNFGNQFGWGLPGSKQAYRKWFTERYGQPPGAG